MIDTPATEPAISLKGVTVDRGGDRILQSLTFDIPSASFTALVGANGSGKTTLFETLLGLLKPRTGIVRVMGASPSQVRHRIAYVAQAQRLTHDAQFVGRDFVAAAFRGHRWGISLRPGAARRAVAQAIETVGASTLADRPLSALSGGQRQRLLIAQALVNEPELLLMDEPLSQLDPGAQEEIVRLAAHLQREAGISVVFSTHDVNPVVDVADRVLYIACCQARIGSVDEVVTDRVLSELYGTPIHVVRERGQVFVMRDRYRESDTSAASRDNVVAMDNKRKASS